VSLTTYNFADVWEAVAPRVADRTAVVCGDRRLTYAELDERANRLAHWMAGHGIGPGSHVAIYLVGGPEYFETMLAAYKLRAVPINVNHRYVDDELRHLFSDAEVAGVVYQRQFSSLVDRVRDHLGDVGWWLAVDDDSRETVVGDADPAYEAALASSEPGPVVAERSNDDLYIIYTGGTTGFPKGVMWRQEDAFFACIGGGDPMRLFGAVDDPSQVVDRIIDGTFVFLPVAPLMHAAGQWTSLSWLFAGGTVVLLPGSLDPLEVWSTIEREKVNLVTVVGDAVVRPLVDEWDADGPFDTSSLLSVGSGGAPLSGLLRKRLMEILPNAAVVDGFGSSETGAQGSQRLEAGSAPSDGITKFTPYGETTTVVDEVTRQAVEPGSDVVGRVALRGRIPVGYYNDPVKSAETFVEIDGHRWVLTGDMARREADGSITLLGRGSGCINTGGEKVFPEEVEAVLKSHPSVYDVLVVGIPDERFGQRVAAVVAPVAGSAPELDELRDHCRAALAGYKVPRALAVVDQVQRSPAGKPDYRWARRVAEAGGALDS
jgi:acyl-CoA synthetase (AMP-forming)/AMP-acid ligase II